MGLLVRAYARARERFDRPTALVFVGGHDGEWELEHPGVVARDLGLDDVFLAGWHEHEELADFYCAADAMRAGVDLRAVRARPRRGHGLRAAGDRGRPLRAGGHRHAGRDGLAGAPGRRGARWRTRSSRPCTTPPSCAGAGGPPPATSSERFAWPAIAERVAETLTAGRRRPARVAFRRCRPRRSQSSSSATSRRPGHASGSPWTAAASRSARRRWCSTAPAAACGSGRCATCRRGISTACPRRSPAQGRPSPAAHPNGAQRLDHVVVTTPDLKRTFAALQGAGIELRRVREHSDTLHQGFFRLGEVILEVVGPPHPSGEEPARFWGLVAVVPDVDALVADAEPGLFGTPRAAVQEGRRIVTVLARRGAHRGAGVHNLTRDPQK